MRQYLFDLWIMKKSRFYLGIKWIGETCVLDVRTIRGQNRKLLLADRGDGPFVYKLEKSKLEDIINVGFI
jgi:hypothetical protein